jgi:hypothetical protein
VTAAHPERNTYLLAKRQRKRVEEGRKEEGHKMYLLPRIPHGHLTRGQNIPKALELQQDLKQ